MNDPIANNQHFNERRQLKRQLFIALLALGLTLCFLLGWVGVASVDAQGATPCPGSIRPVGAAANIRPQPGTTATPIGRLFAGTSAPAQGATQGWHPLCSGMGFVSSDIVRFSTNTPAPTLAASPTRVTPQPSPVPLIVYARVRLLFRGRDIDLGIVELKNGEPVTCSMERVDFFPQPSPTVTALPGR